MSRVTRRKHVLKEMMEDDFQLPKANQQIVRVVCSRGNNLHEVQSADASVENFLVSMPLKFRNNVWVKRGDFVLVDPIEEGNKVKAEIYKILTQDYIKEYTKAGVWPKRFTKKREHDESESDDNIENENGFVVRNMNRPNKQQYPGEVESDDSDDETDEDNIDDNSDDKSVGIKRDEKQQKLYEN